MLNAAVTRMTGTRMYPNVGPHCPLPLLELPTQSTKLYRQGTGGSLARPRSTTTEMVG